MQRALQTTKSRASWKLCSGDSETQETDYSRIGSRQTKRDASFTTLDIPLKHGCKAATQPRQHPCGIGTTGRPVIPCNAKVLSKRMHVAAQSLSRDQLFVTPWTAAHQAPLFFTISWSLLKFMSIKRQSHFLYLEGKKHDT